MCYKVNDAKDLYLKTLYTYYFTLAHKSSYMDIADWLIQLGPLNLYWFSAVY